MVMHHSRREELWFSKERTTPDSVDFADVLGVRAGIDALHDPILFDA